MASIILCTLYTLIMGSIILGTLYTLIKGSIILGTLNTRMKGSNIIGTRYTRMEEAGQEKKTSSQMNQQRHNKTHNITTPLHSNHDTFTSPHIPLLTLLNVHILPTIHATPF